MSWEFGRDLFYLFKIATIVCYCCSHQHCKVILDIIKVKLQQESEDEEGKLFQGHSRQISAALRQSIVSSPLHAWWFERGGECFAIASTL